MLAGSLFFKQFVCVVHNFFCVKWVELLEKITMAPREEKVTPKVNRAKTSATKKPFISSSTVKKTITTVKKTMVMSSTNGKNTIVKSSTNVKTTNTAIDQTPHKVEPRQMTYTAPPTPKPKESKPMTCPGSVTKSAKKAYNRRPKPAHSGVPVPEKMKRILQQQLQDSDSSLIL